MQYSSPTSPSDSRPNRAARCVFLLGLYGSAGVALAEPGSWYLDTRFDQTLASDEEQDLSTPALATDDSGWRLYGGYRFNPTWSLEASYLDSGSTGFEDGDRMGQVSPEPLIPHSDSLQFTGAATLPINSGFSLLGRVSLLHWNATESRSADFAGTYGGYRGTDLSFGAGSYYRLGEKLSVQADWDHYFLDQERGDLFSARLNYRFK